MIAVTSDVLSDRNVWASFGNLIQTKSLKHFQELEIRWYLGTLMDTLSCDNGLVMLKAVSPLETHNT